MTTPDLECLHEDIKLKPNRWGEFDMVFEEGDVVNVDGLESLNNACIIAIMTRWMELKRKNKSRIYDEFGCRVHELVKANMNSMNAYKIELFIKETLSDIQRVDRVNEVMVTPLEGSYGYQVVFNVTAITSEEFRGVVAI